MTLSAHSAEPEIIAHRGASHDAPENSVAAFRLGWEQQADAVEIDVHLSSDGEAVVMHDFSTKRTAGLATAISVQTLAELKQLDIGSWKDPKWAGERIPTLAEALGTVPDGKKIFIEIKCGPEILPALGRALKDSRQKPGQIVLIGFNAETMRQAKQQFPQHQAYWLVTYKKDPQTEKFPELTELIEVAKAARFDGLNLDYHFPVDASFVSLVKSAGLKLYCWTVDDPVVAAAWKAAGVNGITTNCPVLLRESLK